MARSERGFTLVELMVVVAIVGILAAIAIPAFVSHMNKAKELEPQLQLNMLAKNAKTWYQTTNSFPQGTAGVLPAPDGSACGGSTPKFPVSTAWSTDPVWLELDFHVDDPGLFSYHYASDEAKEALAWAVADLDCDKALITYQVELSVPDGSPAAKIVPPTTKD